MRYILSSVGTSLLTNNAGDLNKLLRETANLREDELSAEAKSTIDARIQTVRTSLAQGKVADRRRASAELNGLHGLCGERLNQPQDVHFLVGTDTYQCRATAQLLSEVLQREGVAAPQEVFPTNLSTRSHSAFGEGIRDLIRWCATNLKDCRESNIHVVFNLCGSFKSLQGYLNTIGMFYADEIIYIFEDPASTLIRIPRLPIRLDTKMLEDNRETFATLSEGADLPIEDFKDWPEALWELTSPGSNRGWLSAWGLLMWGQEADRLLADELLKLSRVEYTDRFRRDFAARKGNRRERIEMQQRLVRIENLLEEHKGDPSVLKRDSMLQYDNYSGKHAGIGHFRVNNQGWRVSCTAHEGRLRLLRFGDHSINDDPV
jgi:putative CRISPR-associated protein (TIGR02619 family)